MFLACHLRSGRFECSEKKMRSYLISLVLVSIVSIPVAGSKGRHLQTAAAPATNAGQLIGRWRVKFNLSESPAKNLIFEARAKGAASFFLLDTGPNYNPVPVPQPDVWSELT